MALELPSGVSPCPALLGCLTAQRVPGIAQLFLTRSSACGLYFCIFLLTTVGVPETAHPKPGPWAAPAPLRSVAGAVCVPRMWQEPEILLRIGKGTTTSPRLRALLLLAQHTEGGVRRSPKLQKCGLLLETCPWAEPRPGEGICVGMDPAPGLGLPPQPGSVGMPGEPGDGGLQALQASLRGGAFSCFSTLGNHHPLLARGLF